MPPNQIIPSRLIIYTKDVMQIHNCSSSTAKRKLREVKDAKGKQLHQAVTIAEYTEYFGIDYLSVCKLLNLL